MKRLCFLSFVLVLLARTAMGDANSIDVLKVAESHEHGIKTTIRVGVTRDAGFEGQTFLEIHYPGSLVKKTLPDGSSVAEKYENGEHSLVGFNFRRDAEVNEIYLLVLTANGVKVMDDVCSRLAGLLKTEGRNVAGADLYLAGMAKDTVTVCHWKKGNPKGGFDFQAKISANKIEIVQGTFRSVTGFPSSSSQ